MDPNKNPSNNTQNSSNYPFNYSNPNNYQFQNQSSSNPQNIPNYDFPPSFFMPSAIPNYHPYYNSAMSYSSQPPAYSSILTGNDIVPDVGATEFPEFSTQMTLGGGSGGNEATPGADSSTPTTRKIVKWTTEQNLVLLSGWIKYGTDSVICRNHRSESFWGKKKGKSAALEVVNEDFNEFKQIKAQEFERLEKLAMF